MLKLSDVVNAFSKIGEDTEVYINKETGKSLVLYIDERNSQSIYDELENNIENYLILPNCKAIDSKSIMSKFIETIDNDLIKYEFISVLNSDRPCAKFMDALFHFGLRDTWSDYKFDKMIDLAIKFINYYQLEYEDDINNNKGVFTIDVYRTLRKEYKIKADSMEEALKELDDLLEKEDSQTFIFVKDEKKVK
ncbi:MAG: hypothetical protein J6Y28_06470 [Acholeplasmatales bacterium]|nr:hypothetical protein [Acholeplasmatales bacterium]